MTDQWLDRNSIAIAVFVLIAVIGFPALRRAWRDGQSDGAKLLDEIEDESASSQARIYWKYLRPTVALLVAYAVSRWYFES